MKLIKLASFYVLRVEYLFSSWLYVALLHFSHDLSNWSSPSFANTTFENFPGISFNLLSELSQFQKLQTMNIRENFPTVLLPNNFCFYILYYQ